MGRTLSRAALIGSAIAVGLFVVNLIVGKIAFMDGATSAPGLSDVGEFLLLFLAVLLFTVACLAREARHGRAETDTQIDKGETHGPQG